MDRLIDDFMQDLDLTVLHYGYCLKNFAAYLVGRDLSDVDKGACEDSLDT